MEDGQLENTRTAREQNTKGQTMIYETLQKTKDRAKRTSLKPYSHLVWAYKTNITPDI